MKQIRFLWLFLITCVFALAGWQLAPSSVVVIVPASTGYELSSGYTEWDREQACARIIPFDGAAAYDRHPSDKPILWTFMVNFDLLSPAGNPVGCLRLYHRVDGDSPGVSGHPGAFEGIDGGGILVDTCTRGLSGSVALDWRIATFSGGGYVQCAMDIQTWVSLITDHLVSLNDRTYPGLGGELARFSAPPIDSTHSYQSFTMVASLLSAQSTGTHDLPIMYYDTPVDGFFWTYDQSMLIRVEQGHGINFPRGACTSATVFPTSETPIFWWYDFEQHVDPITKLTRRIRKYEYQIGRDEDLCEVPTSFLSPPLFWIGPATLYIGNTPTSSSFQGSMDGVLVDPTDSRPPK